MCETSSEPRSILRRALRVLLLLSFWYLSSFFLMMDWSFPAFDPDLETSVGGSFYVFADNVRIPGDFTMYSPSACWANWFFYPLDQCFLFVQDAMGLAYFWEYGNTIRVLGLVLLVPNLLLPSLSIFFWDAQIQKRLWVRFLLAMRTVFLALCAAGWYLALVFLYDSFCEGTAYILLGKCFAAIGTILSLGALCWIGRGRSWPLVVPLAFATICGTIWIIMSSPPTF
jgi:hypothetical protein